MLCIKFTYLLWVFKFIKSVCKLDTSKTLLWAGHVTSDGVYSEGDVAALLSPGEKGPLTLLPGVTEARPGPGAAEVADHGGTIHQPSLHRRGGESEGW